MATKQEKRTVENWLNLVDYQFQGYMPTEEALRFVNFIKAVNGGEEENKTPPVHLIMMERVFNQDRRCAIMVHRGAGKFQPSNSPIKTPTGWTTMEDLQVGDEVINRYGKTTTVTFKTDRHVRPTYKMTLTDGSTLEVGDEHKHVVWVDRRKPTARRNTEKVMTTLELIEKGLVVDKPRRSTRDPKKAYRFGIPLVDPIEYSEKMFSVKPYTMGYGIANGYFEDATIHSHSQDVDEIANYISEDGYTVGKIGKSDEGHSARFVIKGKNIFNGMSDLRSKSKYIPEEYMEGSVEQRTNLLRGLMDGDGSIAKNGGCSYSTYSKRLAEDVVNLAQSLGGISYVKEYRRDRLGKSVVEYEVVVNIKINPFRLKRKADKWKPTKKMTRGIVSLEPIGEKEGYCIQVKSNDHTYVTDNYVITHNTTLFAEYLILYMAAFGVMPGFGKVSLMLYVTDSIENGVKNLRRNVEYRYQESEFLQHIIPNQKITVGENDAGYVDLDQFEQQSAGGRKFTDIRLEFMNNKGHRLVVKGYGSKTGVRGAKEMGQRPQLAILDDLVSDEDARSATVVETIENTIYKAVSKALHPTKQKMVFIGTPFNANDPLYKAVESGAWTVSVFPICAKFPVSREEFRGSWEDRFTYDYVKAEYDEAIALGKPENFNQELMLRIMSEEDRLIQNDDMVWYSRKKVLENRSAYNFYITTDFATSSKKGADFSVISVWAYSNNKDWLLVDGVCKQQLMDQSMKDLFRLVSIYKPLSVGVEVTGQQGGFIRWINNEMLDKNVFFNLASSKNGNEPGIRPASDKITRFNQVLPLFKQKKIWFPEEMRDTAYGRELMDELINVSKKGFKSKHDDVADTISMLLEFDAYAPSEDSPGVLDELAADSDIWADFEPDDDGRVGGSTVF
jgi:predicted phage terminase large subunit-like protein